MGTDSPHFERYLGPAAAGDEGALTRLIQEFSSMVFEVALRTTGSAADAEDVMQEVFITLPEALGDFQPGNFAAWLREVTRHRAMTLVRSNARWRDRVRSFAVQESVDDHTLTRIVVEEALAMIDASLRDVFVMKEWHGMTHAEIGRSLGISESASWLRLHRARIALRGILES